MLNTPKSTQYLCQQSDIQSNMNLTGSSAVDSAMLFGSNVLKIYIIFHSKNIIIIAVPSYAFVNSFTFYSTWAEGLYTLCVARHSSSVRRR